MSKDTNNRPDNGSNNKVNFDDFIESPEGLDNENQDIKLLYEKANHDYEKEYPMPESIIKVKESIFGTPGNFSVITGKAKSKKTFLLSAVAASLLTQKTILDNIHGMLRPEKNRILYFDTEQSRYHLQMVIERILKLCCRSKLEVKSQLIVESLKAFSIIERQQILNYAITKEKDVGVVIIDGIRDLVHDINSMEETSNMLTNLLRWIEVLDVHIILVLHQNKNDRNLRGNLGTELLNKCETTVEVSSCYTNKDVAVVAFPYSRNIPADPFGFKVNENGLPIPADVPDTKKIFKPENISKEVALDYLKQAFNESIELKQSQLIENLMPLLNIGQSKTKSFIKYCESDLKLLIRSKGPSNANIYQLIISTSS